MGFRWRLKLKGPVSISPQGQPYINAVSALASKTGDWIYASDGLDGICFEWVFALGAGNVTGTIVVEHTAQLTGTPPTNGSRIMLPLGSLHTSMTQVTLAAAPSPSPEVTLTAVVTGRLEINLGRIPAGVIRCNYVFASGSGASPNTATCYQTSTSRR